VVSSGTLSVKVNDNMGSYFKSSKGVRQRDPLSPYTLTWQQIVWPKWYKLHRSMD
jgi:hypothetical protein